MPLPLIMETDAFEDGGIVPPRYGCFGGNLQPGFKFRNVPADAGSLALIFHEGGLRWAFSAPQLTARRRDARRSAGLGGLSSMLRRFRRRLIVPERKVSYDYAETAVLPEHLRPDRVETLDDAAAEAHGRYQEYVRSLDEVPVLVDVVQEPPRVVVKDFRLGERPDTRKAPRADAAALREQHAAEVVRQYAEYVEICAGLGDASRVGPRQAPAKNGRKTRTQKKRAKRAKRSARSKS